MTSLADAFEELVDLDEQDLFGLDLIQGIGAAILVDHLGLRGEDLEPAFELGK